MLLVRRCVTTAPSGRWAPASLHGAVGLGRGGWQPSVSTAAALLHAQRTSTAARPRSSTLAAPGQPPG